MANIKLKYDDAIDDNDGVMAYIDQEGDLIIHDDENCEVFTIISSYDEETITKIMLDDWQPENAVKKFYKGDTVTMKITF